MKQFAHPVLAATALALAGLSTPAPSTAQELEEVKVALGWLRNGQYSPLMVADAKGFFEEEGLDLTLIDGGPGKNPVPLVGVGQADFGVTGASSIFNARLAKDPIDVVAVGAITQHFPYAYITLADPDDPEPTPADLEGKTVGMQSDGFFLLDALAKKNGVDIEAIEVETVMANAEPLLIGAVDYFTGMLHNQTYQVELEAAKETAPENLKGKTWKAIRFSEYGIPFYHDVIFTSGTMIQENPELIERFLTAVAKGVQSTIDNPEEAVELVSAYPDQVEDEAKLSWRLGIQNPLAVSDDTNENGLLWMSPEVWANGMAFYEEYDQIDRVLPADEVMTNAFNPKIPSE